MATVGQENLESKEYSLPRKCQRRVVFITLRFHRQDLSTPTPLPLFPYLCTVLHSWGPSLSNSFSSPLPRPQIGTQSNFKCR